MSDETTDPTQQMMDEPSILAEAQFTSLDVAAIVGCTLKALEQTVDPKRRLVALSPGAANPGTGRRRMFTGEDVLRVAAIYAMSDLGFTIRNAKDITEIIVNRASLRLMGAQIGTDVGIVTYPMKKKDGWAQVIVTGDLEGAPKLPAAFLYINVDQLIDETLAKLRAILNGEPLPTFEVFEGAQASGEAKGAE